MVADLSPDQQVKREAMAQQTVGMVGLGIMGAAMSFNLTRAGFRVVGFDVVPRRRTEHARSGGIAARSPREVARRTEIVITSLPSAHALTEVAAELAASATRGTIVIETSTLPIPVKEAARDVLARRGGVLLDCPLSGTGAQARVKDLIIYASGDRGDGARNEGGPRPGAGAESRLRRRRQLEDVASARTDDGERRLFGSHDEERGLAEGHDHHRRLRPQNRL